MICCCGAQVPYASPLEIVVGAPLDVPASPNPTDAEVDALHARYVAALRGLYAAHAGAAGYGGVKLVVL